MLNRLEVVAAEELEADVVAGFPNKLEVAGADVLGVPPRPKEGSFIPEPPVPPVMIEGAALVGAAAGAVEVAVVEAPPSPLNMLLFCDGAAEFPEDPVPRFPNSPDVAAGVDVVALVAGFGATNKLGAEDVGAGLAAGVLL